MSEPSSQAQDEARSWWRQMWRQARARWQESSESVALREAVEELIEESSGDGGVPTAERQLLTNILHLRERSVSDCMVPRAKIIAIDVGSALRDLVAVMAEYSHSRIPVYRGTLDETAGMIHIKDVLPCLAEGKTAKLHELVRPILFVAPSMPASKLLLQMRTTRQHMAMVVDEFGGIDGMVTIEDLVEEIVGEIEDEHDDPITPLVIARPDGTLLVDASIAIEDFEERVGPLLTPAERETMDTLAGYVFHLAGHIPKIGEMVKGPHDLVFEILATDPNRIRRVRVRGVKVSDSEGLKDRNSN